MARYTIAGCALSIVTLALASASSAEAQVYKCTQEGGRVLYSDVACKGGTVLDVTAGAADPRAIARLERDGAAFDRMMEARRIADEREAMRRQEIAQRSAAEAAIGDFAANPPQYYGYYDGYYGPGYGLVATPPIREHAHAKRAHVTEHRVPVRPSPIGGEPRTRKPPATRMTKGSYQ